MLPSTRLESPQIRLRRLPASRPYRLLPVAALLPLLALAMLTSGCQKPRELAMGSLPQPRVSTSRSCEQGLLAVSAWECLSGSFRSGSADLEPARP